MAYPITVRAAVLTDRTTILSLLTTKVNSVSPYDELVADWTVVKSYTLADLQAMIGSRQAALPVAIDSSSVMRGWNIFLREDGLSSLVDFAVPDAWHSVYTVTDKSLATADRLSVAAQMLAWGCQRIAGTTYLWGDVKTPGNFDAFLRQQFPYVPLGDRNRYYSTASDFVVKAAGL